MRPHAELLPANESQAAVTFAAWDIDWQTVIDDLGGDEALLQELIDVFVATFPETLNEARTGLARGDLAGVARVAHKLKGTVGNFGLGPAWEASRTLEATAKEARLVETRVAFAAAEQEFAHLEVLLLSRKRVASA
jgi:HPt (histidine-containing phosphotransfer) domain-containing protein